MNIGYKGFDKDLRCRNEQFIVGQTYAKNLHITEPALCSSNGFHYCKSLKNVFNYYRRSDNRFCEIEILGAHKSDNEKSITTSFKILRELTSDEIDELIHEQVFELDIVRSLQKKYPTLHVGGSVGLFLHGVRLKRWTISGGQSDFDFISPYFFLPESSVEDDIDIDFTSDKASGNDFDFTFGCNGAKVDYRIDPKQRYEIVEHKGHKYKVSPLMTILAAKMKYAVEGSDKHREDLIEMALSTGPTRIKKAETEPTLSDILGLK